ncbi:MAG: hypothetical protein HOV66_09575 [Streptomycetaceae bacterium]|nr:hypothetical protein [Streptomycetaceae bacterium]
MNPTALKRRHIRVPAWRQTPRVGVDGYLAGLGCPVEGHGVLRASDPHQQSSQFDPALAAGGVRVLEHRKGLRNMPGRLECGRDTARGTPL